MSFEPKNAKFAAVVIAALAAVTVVAQGLPRANRPPLGARLHPQQTPPIQTTQPAAADATGAGARSIEFNGTPVDMVLKVYGDLVGKTVLKDPQVPAPTFTLQPRQGETLTDEEKIWAIEALLEMNGIHIEPYGEKFVRALPRKDVRREGIPLFMDPEDPNAELRESNKVVSMMIRFKNIATDEAQKALEGLKSNSGILLVFERTNSILATDTEQNIKRMLEIAKEIDIASPVTEVVEYIQIKYANANDIKQVIDSIVQESMKEQEKNGKKPVSQNAPAPQPQRPMIGGLLNRVRPQQPAAPVNNESLIMSVSDADRGMIRGKVVTIADERSNKILIITSASNMKFFKEVIAALDVETTPDTVVKVYRLKYAEAEDVSDMINDLIGNSASSKNSGRANQNQNARQGTSGSVTRNTQTRKSANQRSGEAKAGELTKDNTTVLSDKRINGIVVMTQKDLVPTIEQIIESMDIKLSQVLIEMVIIEVTLGDELQTGMDWVQKGRREAAVDMKDSLGRQLYYPKMWDPDQKEYVDDTVDYSGTPVLEGTAAASTYAAKVLGVAREGLMNNYLGATSVGLSGGSGGGADAYALASGVASNAFSKAFNFIFDSDELGLTAIFNASKSDNRSKYIASPVVMTLDNKEATVNATRMRYLLKGFTSSGNSYSTIAVPDYEQKELGIELKVTPKINPNGTVMLTVQEKYTQRSGTQDIQYSTGTGGDAGLKTVPADLTMTREMSADVLLENNQTVVFGGLTETQVTESESGIPWLKDIPYIGKWLFGSVNESENRVELLVFMTPYVLDDAQSAQVEALRRKKTLSDASPWADHGWSLSPLADPVSQKEQMRRLKDEWKLQDAERQTRMAIEKAKVERAKALKAMSQKEREVWINMHKEELEEEEQKEIDKMLLDANSQEKLKKLAADIRRKRLEEAGKAIKEAAQAESAENERARADEAKATKKDGE